MAGKTSRNAADPVNALLNYAYSLGEIECTLAVRAVGLDPGLGIVHTDKQHRDSLALDLLEPLRPVLERRVLELLAIRHFRASDFHEAPDGTCRLLAPITHELAADLLLYARTVAPHAEALAHALATAHHAPVPLRTPLTKDNARSAQTPTGKRRSTHDLKATPKALPTCRTCGITLTDSRRQLCPTCWPVTRGRLETERARRGMAERARRLAAGEPDPTRTPQAQAKRHGTLKATKAAQAAWDRDNADVTADPGWFREHVLPRLGDIALSRLQGATGLSVSACSRIRSGALMPHPRHWASLADLAGTSWEAHRLDRLRGQRPAASEP